MGLKLFNTTNQRLNAFEMLMMNKFNTYDFAGLYKNLSSPILIIDNQTKKWKWNTGVLPSRMIGGGCMFYLEEDDTFHAFTSTDPTVWAYRINLNDPKDISTDVLKNVDVEEIKCDSIERTAYSYELPNVDTGLSDLDYTASEDAEAYQYCFTIDGVVYNYWCNTIWLNDHEFLIPVCCGWYSDGDDDYVISRLITAKDKASLEDFLTNALFNQLMNYINSTFVWHEAGSEQSGTSTLYKKGQIGKLLVEGNQIKNVDDLDSDDVYKNELDLAADVLCMSKVSPVDDLPYQSRDILMLDTPNDEELKPRVHRLDTLDVANGGTGGTTRETAKTGLGIYYGTTLPTSTSPVSQPQNGDIYFLLNL